MSHSDTHRTHSRSGIRTRGLLALVTLLCCAGFLAAPSLAAAAPSPAPGTAAPPPRAPTLFVLRGLARTGPGDLAVRIRNVEWFTDRPVRRAGTMTARTLVRNWQAWGFAHDPPNAALTGHHLDVVVELSAPRVRGGQLHFHVKSVRGHLPHGNLGGVSAFVDATSPATATASTVQIVNNSGAMTMAYVFVTAGYTPVPLQSTAWLTTYELLPGTSSSLKWDTSTQLMWADQQLATGISFEAQQTLSLPPAGPGQTGVADLTQQNGSISLQADPMFAGLQTGSLAVKTETPNAPVFSGAAVALGLSGSPALVAPAGSDMTTFPVTRLTYWLASGFAGPSQVLGQFETANAVQLDFTPGITSLTATLNADGQWSVQPS
ncbi:MAG: hypothetical protein JWL73_543 [Actinomycetia bacterium]|nr:hypothetical protein [Actinomycetes bacterium]